MHAARCPFAIQAPEPHLTPEFAKTGLLATPLTQPPTRFQVLGERSSGTNFVKRLLGRNSALTPTEALGWKHASAQAMAIPPDLAVICVVRAPEPWALSMHSKPWHTTPAMQKLAFSDFIRAPWDTVIDRPRYFPGAAEAGTVGQPLQADRDPVTGARPDTLFALRRMKLASLTGILNRSCTCVLLRLESLQSAPEAQLDVLLAALGQPKRTAPFRPVMKRLGSKFKAAVAHRPATPKEISAEDLAFMRNQLDHTQETALGYAI
ncbi:MAG: hypothetical protein AB8B51_14290 [Sedimentitalea sp.]